MNLVVTLGSALTSRYGSDGLAFVTEALRRYEAAADSCAVAILDDDASMGALGMAAIPAANAGTVLGAIRSIRGVMPEIDALMIVGGDSVVPYWRIMNPVQDRAIDPDAVVYTDNPYGSTSDSFDDYLTPSLAVGRLCDSAGGSAAEFASLIDCATANHLRRPQRAGSATVVNRDWMDASARVIQSLASPVDMHEAPGYEINDATKADTDRRFLYFNLHGFPDDPAWKGFDRVRGQFFPVATPDSFDGANIAGSIVFAENCYGALTIDKNSNSSCALRLLQQGSAGFVGATGLAFGSHIEPGLILENADLLALRFFQGLAGGAFTLGAALVYARQAFMADSPVSGNNIFAQKTLLQFTLLGDPSLD